MTATCGAVGAAWANGPLRIGASFASQNQDAFANGDVDRYSLAGSYNYAPGMQLRAGVFYWDTDSNVAYEDPIMVAIGTVISF